MNFGFELDDFQKRAIEYIETGNSVVVCAPTGAGKTCIAQYAIEKAIRKGTKIFYTTPLKALSNQKYRDFASQYGNENTGLLTGDTSINRDASIIVMTTEVFRNILYGTNFGAVENNLKNVQFVVLDEVHYMNDEQRGTVWEESIIYCPSNIQIIALSATVNNSDQLTEWINSVHSKTKLVFTDFRPVPLRHFYFDCEKKEPTIIPILTPEGNLNSKINKLPKKIPFCQRKKQKPINSIKNLINILNKKDMLPCIYFTFSRKKCDEQMEKCSELNLLSKSELLNLERIVDKYIAKNPYLWDNKHLKYLKLGVASHHAGLLPGWKILVEKLFQMGLIKVVFATETLSAGINMPARTTVISSISKRCDTGHRILTANEFLQMSGRAGRRGMDDLGYVIVVSTPFEKPTDIAKLVKSPANPLESKFTPTYSMVTNLLQRFSLDQAKQLILKSFGYFCSHDRLKPYYDIETELKKNIISIQNYPCIHNLSNEDVKNFCRVKNEYIKYAKLVKILQQQSCQKKSQQVPYDNIELDRFKIKKKQLSQQMQSFKCFNSKCYKSHIKKLDELSTLNKRLNQLTKKIILEKDIYWQNFLNHLSVLEQYGYIENNFPNDKGNMLGKLKTTNEIFLSEIILSGILDELNPVELASVCCAIVTEDAKSDIQRDLPIAKKAKYVLSRIKEIKTKLEKVEGNFNIESHILINSSYSPLIEYWMDENAYWDYIVQKVNQCEGDIVRVFKRTIDLLKQLSNLSSQEENKNLVENSRLAINLIYKTPIDID